MESSDVAPSVPLTFKALEERLRVLPEFPADTASPSRLVRGAATVLACGIASTLIASFFSFTSIPPQLLAKVATTGFWVALAALGVLMIISLYGIVSDLRQWTVDQAMRTDHQLEQFLQEVTWLKGYPAATLQLMLDHARYSHTRRAGRIALLAGSVDKLGLLPVAASLFLVMRAGGNPLAMSPMTAMVGILLLFFWMVCWVATSARGKLQTYEYLLEMALKGKEKDVTAADA
ncbi:hypothetical protein [Xanthomonas arboricola]|uniref:hypothetical protein n=1 Tax=Xanthomonas arboricola TaxID=56448 RepID=UPI000CEE8845|nr:hypothetical protein [Xanthomonas arboricola]PPU42769.1 hypothetical protein XaplCFBP3123_06290 [Xanthomonas arboricola pv. populi]